MSAPSFDVTQKGATLNIEAKGLNPSEMRNHIGNVQSLTLYPLILYILGMTMIGFTIWFFKFKEKWFYFSLWVLSLVIMLPFIPIGTIMAVFVITHLIRQRGSYFFNKNA